MPRKIVKIHFVNTTEIETYMGVGAIGIDPEYLILYGNSGYVAFSFFTRKIRRIEVQ